MNETDVATYAAESAAASNVMLAVMTTMGIFAVVFAVAWYILQVIAYWKIFTKAGRPGWHSIIPFLNNWDEVDLSWNRTMAWVVTCLSVVGCIISVIITNQQNQGLQISSTLNTLSYIVALLVVVLGIICEYKLAKAFGKGVGFFLGLVFLNPIFMLILGFGSAQYLGRQE
ncbi:MAG: hypothetical protein II969_16590 [Anaerolineaceae bacterium]|nr:hypothetical protein [Anaerolineaceae bacterium]